MVTSSNSGNRAQNLTSFKKKEKYIDTPPFVAGKVWHDPIHKISDVEVGDVLIKNNKLVGYWDGMKWRNQAISIFDPCVPFVPHYEDTPEIFSAYFHDTFSTTRYYKDSNGDENVSIGMSEGGLVVELHVWKNELKDYTKKER